MGMDALEVRLKNVDRKYPIEDMIKILKEKSEYDSRKSEVGKFNKVDVLIFVSDYNTPF